MKQCASRPYTQTTVLNRVAVKFIPDDRTTEIGRVNADLMGAPRFDDADNVAAQTKFMFYTYRHLHKYTIIKSINGAED